MRKIYLNVEHGINEWTKKEALRGLHRSGEGFRKGSFVDQSFSHLKKTHNRLLLQDCPLQITLLPKLCCYG